MRIHRSKGVVTRKDHYYCTSGIYCDNKSTNAEIAQHAIRKALQEYLEDFKTKIDHIDTSHIERQQNIIINLENEYREMEKREEELYDFLEKKIYTPDIYLMRKEKLTKEMADMKQKIKDIKQTVPEPIDYENKYYSLFEALNALDNPNISAKIKNNLLKKVIKVIYYEKDVNDKSNPHGIGLENSNVKLDIELY